MVVRSSRSAVHDPRLAVIFVTVFIDLVGFGIVIPVLPLYAERFGASPLVIGWLLGIYSLMQLICSPILGRLSDRFGRRPVLLLSIIGTSVGFFLMGCAKTLPLLFLARIIDGITGANISTAQAYIADVTPPEHRSRGMGLIGAAFGLGFILGPAIGGVLSHFSLAAPFFFASLLAAGNAVAIYFFLPESLPQRLEPTRSRLALLLQGAQRRPLLTAAGTYFLVTAGFSLLTATYALFAARRFGYQAMQIGYIFAAQGLLGAMIQGLLLGRLLRVFTDKALVIAGTLILAAGMWGLPGSTTVAALLAATTAVAVGHALVAAPLSGLASRKADASVQGSVFGLMQSAASLARIVGPVLGGWLLSHDAAGFSAAFGRSPYWTGAGIMLGAFALALAL